MNPGRRKRRRIKPPPHLTSALAGAYDKTQGARANCAPLCMRQGAARAARPYTGRRTQCNQKPFCNGTCPQTRAIGSAPLPTRRTCARRALRACGCRRPTRARRGAMTWAMAYTTCTTWGNLTRRAACPPSMAQKRNTLPPCAPCRARALPCWQTWC